MISLDKKKTTKLKIHNYEIVGSSHITNKRRRNPFPSGVWIVNLLLVVQAIRFHHGHCTHSKTCNGFYINIEYRNLDGSQNQYNKCVFILQRENAHNLTSVLPVYQRQ